ncbi:MAG: response regulator [Bdellovibrionales bacterium]|nr:response regulator [Bdellovibrionales bacterium]
MRPKVLIVDRDPTVGKWINQVLSRAGFEITCVENPEAILPLVREGGFELLLIDYDVQKSKKSHFVNFLSFHHPDLPIVLMATQNMSDLPKEALYACADYIEKPFPADVLLEMCRAYTKSREHKQSA